MSGERDTARQDIGLLMAAVADEVVIGPPPCGAIVRGGRRRRARRLAVAVTSALLIAGTAGTTLALTGATGERPERSGTAQGPTAPAGEAAPAPERTTLAVGQADGEEWRITIDTWAAPEDAAQAARLSSAMSDAEYPDVSRDGRAGQNLIGAAWFFAHLRTGDRDATVLDGRLEDAGSLRGGVRTGLVKLSSGASESESGWLVVGQVAPGTSGVVCSWDDGTSTTVPVAPPGAPLTRRHQPMLRPVEGSSLRWFVVEVPEGRTFGSAEAMS